MRLKFIACKFTVFIQNVQDVKKIISFIKKQLSPTTSSKDGTISK